MWWLAPRYWIFNDANFLENEPNSLLTVGYKTIGYVAAGIFTERWKDLIKQINTGGELSYISYIPRHLPPKWIWVLRSFNLKISNNNNNNDLLTDPLGGSSLLNYIKNNYKINQIKLFTNHTVEAGSTVSNYSKTN